MAGENHSDRRLSERFPVGRRAVGRVAQQLPPALRLGLQGAQQLAQKCADAVRSPVALCLAGEVLAPAGIMGSGAEIEHDTDRLQDRVAQRPLAYLGASRAGTLSRAIRERRDPLE